MALEEWLGMNQTNDDAYHRRISELEAENARLRERLESVKADRKQLRDALYGKEQLAQETTEEEYLELVRNHQPGSTARILAELGISPRKSS
jgi:predicted nuclease with TOPRIM domain